MPAKLRKHSVDITEQSGHFSKSPSPASAAVTTCASPLVVDGVVLNDRSKTFVSVPPMRVVRRAAPARWYEAFCVETGLNTMEPWERRITLGFFLVVTIIVLLQVRQLAMALVGSE